MAWTKTKPVEPFKYDWKRDPCDCSQEFKLAITGYSEKQGPTHYCPGCRWAFWTVEMKPTAAQVTLAKKDDPKACEANMKYLKLRNKPAPKWGTTSENIMLDQLGKLDPTFFTRQLSEYWAEKYCKKYPNCDRAKARAKWKEEQDRKFSRS